MTQPKDKHWAKALSDAINLVTSIAAAIGACGIAGWWLDGRYGTGPWLTVFGVLIGTATGFKIMWDRLNKDSKTEKSDGI